MVTHKQAKRRYLKLFWPFMTLYVAACFAGPFVMTEAWRDVIWLRYVVAFATAAPICAVFWLKARYILEADELTRRIQLEAVLAGASVTVCVAIIWGFLELFRLVPNMWTFLVGPLYFATYGLAQMIVRRRYA